jgi:hypothetical protein
VARLFTNNAATTLAAGISSAATSFAVSTGAGALFPVLSGGNTFRVTLFQVVGGVEANWEVVEVAGRAGDTFSSVTRGVEGIARTYNAGDGVSLRLTAGEAQGFGTLLSINGDGSQAQTFVGAGTVSVTDGGGGAHTITGTGGSAITSINADTTAAQTIVGAAGITVGTTGGVTTVTGSALVQIQKITTAASQASVHFASIPATYQDLEVRWMARSNVAAASEVMSLNVNSDVASGDYTLTQFMNGNNLTASAAFVAASILGIAISSVTGATGPAANEPSSGRTYIENYLGTVFYKRVSTVSAVALSGGNAREQLSLASGVWTSTAAVTDLLFTVPTSFLNGSVFALYGIGH